MKQLFYCFVVMLVLIACTNNDTPKVATTDTPTDTSQKTGPEPTEPPGDTTVWAGSFAIWTNQNNDPIPGYYDTTNGVFAVCKTDRMLRPDKDKVKLATGDCDSNTPLRLALIYINKDSARRLPGELVALNTSSTHVRTAVFHINGREKKVLLNEKQYRNINSVKARKISTHLIRPN